MSSWQDLADILESTKSTQGQREEYLSERHYRRGYWDGVYAAVEYLAKGATKRQIESWCWHELKRWSNSPADNLVMPPRIIPWKKLRLAILEAHNETCAYCGKPATHVDHVIPVCADGSYEVDNLVAACAQCNLKKGRYSLNSAGMRIRYPASHRVKIKEIPGYYKNVIVVKGEE